MPVKTLRLLALLSATLFATITHAQWVSIPDTNFGKWLNINGYSQCLQGNSTLGWQMDTTCGAVVNAVTLNCEINSIADITGIQYFDSLDSLDCARNNLSYLPNLPPALLFLDCSVQFQGNGITSLPQLPSTLLYLLCKNNAINSLPSLPVGLRYLNCAKNQLAVLPILPDSLKWMECSENSLTNLPVLPLGFKTLYCDYNPVQSIPNLPPGIEALMLGYTNLSSLPTLPSSMQRLGVAGSPITALPTLPPQLLLLDCSYDTLLTSLPALPASLRTLYCSGCQLTGLPHLPSNLTSLWCSDNRLTSIPELPDTLIYLYISNNPLLNCLPRLKYIYDFRYDSTGIACLPNYPTSNFMSSPPLNLLPLCGVLNPYGCPGFVNVSGNVYHDNNSNCLFSQGDVNASSVPIQLWQGGAVVSQALTDSGYYFFGTPAFSTYQITIDTSNIPFRILCPSTGSLTSVISAADSMDYNMDFALECKPGFDLEAHSLVGGFRPVNFTTIQVLAGDASNFYDARCAAGINGSVTLAFTGPVKYISPANGALTPTSVTNNTLTWSIADFGNVNFFEDFDVIMQTDTFAQIGQQVCFTLTASPIINDNNPANNTFTICFPVVNSYDPNDKQAYPAGNIDTLQEDLVYTVRFQNTGNALAQHIYITDTLSAHVRPETFELLAYSHQPMVQIDGKAVRFNFANINLPDSFTNEPASHGYVQYRVKLKENLPVGTVINNTAFIYFDFNAPVITNTTTNTVSVEVDTTVGIRNIKPTTEVFVYPNPASKAVTITVSESMSNATVSLTDLLGRKAVEPVWLNNTRSLSLNTQHLSEGVYIVNIASKAGTTLTRRLVINH